jgi:nitrite reductase/ring-hydroxylating ferredoxin subunit
MKPQFLRHQNELVDNKIIPLIDRTKVLVSGDTVRVYNNVCPHQRSRICNNKQKYFQCQYHGWQWDLNGTPLNNEVTLKGTPVHNINGLLFNTAIDIPELAGLNIERYQLVEERVDRVDADWKHIVDVFLDVDHIPVVHEGVYESIGITDESEIKWNYYDWGNTQQVYSENKDLVAVWVMLYPYTMIEWQAGSLFITVCNPKDSYTDVTVLKYSDPENSSYTDNSKIFETAWQQDKQQAENIISFPKTVLDEQKMHFRHYLDQNT